MQALCTDLFYGIVKGCRAGELCIWHRCRLFRVSDPRLSTPVDADFADTKFTLNTHLLSEVWYACLSVNKEPYDSLTGFTHLQSLVDSHGSHVFGPCCNLIEENVFQIKHTPLTGQPEANRDVTWCMNPTANKSRSNGFEATCAV